MKTKVIIVGGGAAGLACAQALHNSEIEYHLYEARNYLGGRAHSKTLSSGLHVELGAEFIHGKPHPLVEKICTASSLPFVDVDDHHLYFNGKKLEGRHTFFERIEKISRRLRENRKHDQSVSAFIQKLGNRFSGDERKLFQSYVEGFHAADPEKMSERALAVSEKSEAPRLTGVRQFRLSKGYSTLFSELSRNLPHIHLSHCLKNISWDEKSVICHFQQKSGRMIRVNAEALVLTVPPSILKSRAGRASFTITPEISSLNEALEAIDMGAVYRLAFLFKSRFWEELSDKPFSFLHGGPQDYFPTWWAETPLHLPLLIAWQGGPKAQKMKSWSAQKRKCTALQSLSRFTEKSTSFLESQLQKVYSHDWCQDPFSLGAYSYVKVHETSDWKRLQRAFAKRIFIAGEATVDGADRGTVGGAMKSGERAAKQIKRLLAH
ncbi:flavin monoamine oxidase family protein [Bdellovibrio sp. HCB2-146]|uniref:flavin monoamine oxidase family protein n=1 Tax=Bdellovibrio sp. HCB2-146 TaxID=3394362 RepID=UPI0039BCC579